MSGGIDPITLAVLAGRMEQIADEMDATLFRAAFNPIIAEAHDASHGLYHAATGDTLVQGKSGLPIFVGVMSFAVKAVIDKAAEAGDLADGDIYIFNDAHMGGTHLSDMRLVRPYFRDGELFCYLASVGHWHDVGGAVPGNYNPSATEAFQEAFVLPPVKLARKGEVQQDIIDILLRNTRLPQSAMGDLNGQLGALDLGVKRLDALLDEYGAETVRAALDALQDRAEALMRAELTDLPDGRWEAEDFLDNDGITDTALPIRVALEISGDRMILDFAGTAPVTAGPVNIALPTAVATAYVAIKHIFPDLPANAGVMRPIEVRVPEGSLLGGVSRAGGRLYRDHPQDDRRDLLRRVTGRARAGRGQRLRHDQRAVAGGQTRERAALGHVQLLRRRPWRKHRRRRAEPRQRADLHGDDPADGDPRGGLPGDVPAMGAAPRQRRAGAHRGGLGAVYEIELLEENAEAFLFGERGRFPPQGVSGGAPGAMNVFHYETDDGWHVPPLASKMLGIKLRQGAGGAPGDPRRRRLRRPGGSHARGRGP
jgi:N-methylhydantoinase B